jgi:hypothetical protein
MEGAVREYPLLPSFQLSPRLTYLECFARDKQMQGKSLFKFRSSFFILTDLYSRTHELTSNGESNVTW